MKKKTINNPFAIIFTCLLACNSVGFAQDSGKVNQSVESRIKNKNFVFVAESVLPMGSRTIQLTSWYDLKVSGDSIYSYLPYFGRAFSAPINTNESGYMFNSAGIRYEAMARKKDGWEVTITPQHRRYGEKFMLTVFGNGQATLRVTSNNRQSIAYRGYIREKNA